MRVINPLREPLISASSETLSAMISLAPFKASSVVVTSSVKNSFTFSTGSTLDKVKRKSAKKSGGKNG